MPKADTEYNKLISTLYRHDKDIVEEASGKEMNLDNYYSYNSILKNNHSLSSTILEKI